MATTVQRPPATVEIVPEQRIVLRGVSWETYERLLADQPDRSSPRFAYDRGELEIVAPSTEHEEDNRTLALLVEIVAAVLTIDVRNVGSLTFKRSDLAQGFEPDTCFYIQNEPTVRGHRPINPALDPPPDLVIEVDVTSHSLDKLPIYARAGVPEVWRCVGGRVMVLVLRVGGYEESATSEVLPVFTTETLNRFLAQSLSTPRSTWLLAAWEWARQRAVGG